MRTIQFTIPNYYRETVEKMVKKASKNIEEVSVKFGTAYKKAYQHAVLEDGTDMFTRKTATLMHEVIDMELSLPDANGWVLKCQYEQGAPHITDMTKPLEIKVAGHGDKYDRCDACGHKAWAKSYLIENIETGEELQVGSECMKSFGITKLVWVEKLMRSLYEALDYRTKEHEYYDFDDAEHWNFGKDPYATQSVEVADCIRAAKKYYEVFNGAWIGGYYSGRHYVSSESKAMLSCYIFEKNFAESATDEYVASLLTFISDIVFPNAEAPSWLGGGFEWQMCETLKNHYMSIKDCSFAFFAVKKYEQYLAANKLQKIDVGQYIHVVGIVTSHTINEGYYGKYDSYEVKSNAGYVIRRNGKIPTVKADGATSTEFYAMVEYVSKKGELSIGRATTKPKKGIQYLAI